MLRFVILNFIVFYVHTFTQKIYISTWKSVWRELKIKSVSMEEAVW